MSEAEYKEKHYTSELQEGPEAVMKSIKAEGFEPLLIRDYPGKEYAPHSHPETKLLGFIEGRMRVSAGGREYTCQRGDRLLIRGNVEHSAKVGSEGCVFYWAEKKL